jgi:hypothetical protein
LTLAELIPAAQSLPAADKLKLIRVLAEDLDAGNDISPLIPDKVYCIPTPYNVFGTGQALMDAMEQADRGHEQR